MKKSIAILSSLALVVAAATMVAGDEEPEHKPRATASEDRKSHTSRNTARPSLSLDAHRIEAELKRQAEVARQAAIEKQRKRKEQEAARIAAAEAAERKAAAERRAAEERARKAAQQKRERQKKQPPTQERPINSAPSGNIKQYAASLVGAGQFGCLNSLWMKESGWNHLAQNPSSGAYGIPQALPGSKMASAGADWQTNPYTQIRWGVNYIKSRYGTPCAAWSHSQQHNWY